jgi:hypothetical protein
MIISASPRRVFIQPKLADRPVVLQKYARLIDFSKAELAGMGKKLTIVFCVLMKIDGQISSLGRFCLFGKVTSPTDHVFVRGSILYP